MADNPSDTPNSGKAVSRSRSERVRLRASEQRFRALAEHTTDMVCLHEPDGCYTYVSPSVRELLGYTPSEMVGLNPYELFHPEDKQRIRTEVHTPALQGVHHLAVSYRIRKKNGEYTWFETLTRPIFDNDGKVIQLQTSSRDISKRKAAEEALQHQALHDVLTGLPNRLLLNDRLSCALARARRHNTMVGLLFCDLDSFKLVNDSLGHEVGDSLLKVVSERLKQVIRNEETVARFGGDEFIVVCEGLSHKEQASEVVDRIRSTFAEPFLLGEAQQATITVSASIGLVCDDGRSTSEDLLRDADIAMYEAKRAGRDNVITFEEHFRTSVRNRLDTLAALSLAITNNELELHYQPEVRLRDGKTVAFEALLRWEQPQRGVMSACDFIPIAEETGLILALGEWVTNEASRQLYEWRRSHSTHEYTMWINVSARQLTDPRWLRHMERLHEMFDNDLGIEVTESSLIQDSDAAVKALRQLRRQGIKVALDDFGVGYSSLAYLRHLPVDILKIDRSFVADLGEDDTAEAIVASVIGLAHRLDLVAVAEGVENGRQLEILKRLNCDVAQGFYLSRPMKANDLFPMIHASC
ncbi:MAG: EAL domain-containing protein [Myxococcales bacterium]|nr:MAG: EAL domain-containing protein [Myxococcales bacterium]